MNPPRVPADLVERPRLYDLLDHRRPLTVVTAPAGYGKSTLISSWLRRCGMRSAWIALDGGDSRLDLLLGYLLAAIDSLFPEISQRLADQAQQSAAMPYAALAHALAEELDALEESFVLVLDDYHLVNEPAAHRFLTELLRYPPPSLNLVVISRVEPPLQLAALRVQDRVAEVRAFDLRFTLAETAEYLRRTLAHPIDDRSLAILEETTEGWIAGLHLAAHFLRNQEDIAGAAARFKGSNRSALDYLAVEVLARQDIEVQQFLVKTSVLQRMIPALCDAVLGDAPGTGRSERILEQLERNNLFLVTLDDGQQWYRYHQLFQQLLEHRLRATHTSEELATIYRRASGWCAGQGLAGEAATYALAAGDVAEAVDIIERHRHALLDTEHWQQLEPLLQLLPRRDINAHAELVIFEAWILHKRERLAELPGRLDLAEALLAASSRPAEVEQRLRSEIAVLRSQQYLLQGDVAHTTASARRALELAPPAYATVRAAAWFYAILGAHLAGGADAALALLEEAARGEVHPAPTVLAKRVMARAFVHWLAADLPQLRQAAEELRWLSDRHDLPESRVWAYYFRGCAAYQQDDLTVAGEAFLSVLNSRQAASTFVFMQGAFGLAATLHAQSNVDAAQSVIAMIGEYAQEATNATALPVAQACAARFALMQGRYPDAYGWAATADRKLRLGAALGFCAPPLALTAILVAQNTPGASGEAEHLLRHFDAQFAAFHHRLYRIEILVQMVRLYGRRAQAEAALAALREAVALAAPSRVLRLFVDAGPELAPWLDQVVVDGDHRDFVAHLRSALQPVPPASPPRGVAQAVHSTLEQPKHPDLIELLTHREMEVLQLMALRLTNKEIAQSMGISTETVKQHAMNVFRKLHVENRREAIVQARAMGFRLDVPFAL